MNKKIILIVIASVLLIGLFSFFIYNSLNKKVVKDILLPNPIQNQDVKLDIKNEAKPDVSNSAPIKFNLIGDDTLNLQKVLENKIPDYVKPLGKDYKLSVLKSNGDHYIFIGLTSNSQGIKDYPNFYAFKSKDGWEVVFNGKESPKCSDVEKYKFPSDIIDKCLMNDGKTLIENKLK